MHIYICILCVWLIIYIAIAIGAPYPNLLGFLAHHGVRWDTWLRLPWEPKKKPSRVALGTVLNGYGFKV